MTKEKSSQIHTFKHKPKASCRGCNHPKSETFWIAPSREDAIAELEKKPGRKNVGLCGTCLCATMINKNIYEPSDNAKPDHGIIPESEKDKMEKIVNDFVTRIIREAHHLKLEGHPNITWKVLYAEDKADAKEQIIEFEKNKEEGNDYHKDSLWIVDDYNPAIVF